MPRAGADMGEARVRQAPDSPALGIDGKARLEPPASGRSAASDNPVHRRIGAGLNTPRQFFHLASHSGSGPPAPLRFVQVRSRALNRTNPVAQGLAIHPTDPCGSHGADHHRRSPQDHQQTAALGASTGWRVSPRRFGAALAGMARSKFEEVIPTALVVDRFGPLSGSD